VLPLAVAGVLTLSGCGSEKKELTRNFETMCEEAYVLEKFWEGEFKTEDGFKHGFFIDEMGRNIVPVAAICRDSMPYGEWSEEKTEQLKNLYPQLMDKLNDARNAQEDYLLYEKKE
jgi:hypothetical protein